MKNLKRVKICYIIAMIVFLIQFILDLIIDFSEIISNRISINVVLIAFSDWKWWGIFIGIIGSLFIGIFAEKIFSLPNTIISDMDKLKNGENYTFLPKNYFFNMTVELILSSPFIIALLSVLSGQYGTYGLAGIPAIVGHIFFIITYCQTLKVFNNINKKQNNANKKQSEKTGKASKLLKKTGKIFFIKYYNQLKKQNIIDIMDIIQENYSENIKRSRIISAKKIFSKNLQVEALNIIIKNEDELANQEIISLCKSILETETRETNNQISEKNDLRHKKTKKPDIVPDCSYCKYRIDETTCEIWREKPAAACEEFIKDNNYLNFKI